jgi:hypothetical protein
MTENVISGILTFYGFHLISETHINSPSLQI